jgi:hypothetical protein
VGIITKKIKANPLNWMKNDQRKTETQIIQYRYGVRNQFFHA